MNLFQNTSIIQSVRDAYDLTIPQAIAVLIAAQHGTVSTQTVREVMGYDARELSSRKALSVPVRKKILEEVGKARVTLGTYPSTIYKVANPDRLAMVIKSAGDENMRIFKMVSAFETEAQEALATTVVE